MILGCIADDFTGAADIAGILVAEGMATTLVTDVADVARDDTDACVVALKTRSIAADLAVAISIEALKRLRDAGCQQIFFKYCSTFDSTPAGNIGPVAGALMRTLGVQNAVVCPAFPANGRTVFQGNLFVGDRPLSESSMRDHPLTPMRDSDIRRWLAQQTGIPVHHIAHTVVRDGSAAIGAALAQFAGLVVVDAIDDQDLRAIGIAVANAPLVTGASALAMGLPHNLHTPGRGVVEQSARRPAKRRAVVLAGSCSAMTNRQVSMYARKAPAFAIDVAALLAGEDVREAAEAFLAQHVDTTPLLYSTASPEASGRFIDGEGRNIAADAIERLLADLALRAQALRANCFVVAGGETSGAVISALCATRLRVGELIAPGVPVLYDADRAFALKSGNFGDEDFFAKALKMLGHENA